MNPQYPQNPLKCLFDGLRQRWQEGRANSQMTLGGLLDHLKNLPPETEVEAFGNPHSYRGYYEDLAFEKSNGTLTAIELWQVCQSCMGEIFNGYKGGDFQMGRNTPVWLANYGQTGQAILKVNPDGTLELRTDED